MGVSVSVSGECTVDACGREGCASGRSRAAGHSSLMVEGGEGGEGGVWGMTGLQE